MLAKCNNKFITLASKPAVNTILFFSLSNIYIFKKYFFTRFSLIYFLLLIIKILLIISNTQAMSPRFFSSKISSLNNRCLFLHNLSSITSSSISSSPYKHFKRFYPGNPQKIGDKIIKNISNDSKQLSKNIPTSSIQSSSSQTNNNNSNNSTFKENSPNVSNQSNIGSSSIGKFDSTKEKVENSQVSPGSHMPLFNYSNCSRTSVVSKSIEYFGSKREYSTEIDYNFKMPSAEVQREFPMLNELVPGHINKVVFTCDYPECALMICNGLCGFLKTIFHKGNFTHTPPPGSDFVLVSNTDIDGNIRNQYFVYNNNMIQYSKDPTTNSDSGLTVDNVARKYSEDKNI